MKSKGFFDGSGGSDDIWTDWKNPTIAHNGNNFPNANNILVEDGVFAIAEGMTGDKYIVPVYSGSGSWGEEPISVSSTLQFVNAGGATELWGQIWTVDRVKDMSVFTVEYSSMSEVRGSGFDFSEIPSIATINGIEVRIKHRATIASWDIDVIQARVNYSIPGIYNDSDNWQNPENAFDGVDNINSAVTSSLVSPLYGVGTNVVLSDNPITSLKFRIRGGSTNSNQALGGFVYLGESLEEDPIAVMTLNGGEGYVYSDWVSVSSEVLESITFEKLKNMIVVFLVISGVADEMEAIGCEFEVEYGGEQSANNFLFFN